MALIANFILLQISRENKKIMTSPTEEFNFENITHRRINDTHVYLYNKSEFSMEEEEPVEALVLEFK